MFRSLKQCVKQYCPPQEEQQGDMLLFINSYALNPHRRGRAALFLSLREEVGLNSLRYVTPCIVPFGHVCGSVSVCLYTHRDGIILSSEWHGFFWSRPTLTHERCESFLLPFPIKWHNCVLLKCVFTEEEVLEWWSVGCRLPYLCPFLQWPCIIPDKPCRLLCIQSFKRFLPYCFP